MTPKQMLVDAISMLERAGHIDHSGHCSLRVDATSFLINSGASVRCALTTEDLVTVSLDGAVIAGGAKPPLEYHIHSEIFRARPDVAAVIHTHPPWSTLLTMAGARLQPVWAQGALIGEVPVMDSPLSVNTQAAGLQLARTLGASRAVLLKSHGAVIIGADLVEAFALAMYLEENARRQYLAMQIGAPYVFSAAEQRACRANLASPSLFEKTWQYYRTKLLG